MSNDPMKNSDFDNSFASAGNANENRSPSYSPTLLDSVASSGSPAFNNRRNGSAGGEKSRKDREERMKMIRERQEQDHERRMSELRAAQEREERIRQLKEAEREKRIKDHRERDIHRRNAVEERRKALEVHETEKRQQIIAKYKEYEDKLSQSNRSKRPVYAFGSSTPRTLAYLEHLDNAMKVYNTRLQSTGAPPGGDGADGIDSSGGQKRAVSAVNLNRRPLSSKRPGSVMTMSMHVSNNSPSLPHHHVAHNDLLSPNDAALASATSMTASFAAGESRIVSNIKNVRLKPHPPSASRSQSTPRHRSGLSSAAASSANPARKMQETMRKDVQAARAEASSPKPRGPPPSASAVVVALHRNNKSSSVENSPKSSGSGKLQPAAAGTPKQRPTPRPRKLSDPQQSEEDAKHTLGERRRQIREQQHQQQQQNHEDVDDPVAAATAKPQAAESVEVSEYLESAASAASSSSVVEHFESASSNISVAVDDSSVGDENLSSQRFDAPPSVSPSSAPSLPRETLLETPQNEEEAKALLAERRRLAREQIEREKEQERQRELERQREEEERLRQEEEEFRRQEAEELQALELARQVEEERLRKAVEEQRLRLEEENRRAEEEKRKQAEAEEKAREAAERAEKERKELAEKAKREEEDRLERKKKLEAIMQRTRQSTAAASNSGNSTPKVPSNQNLLSINNGVASGGGVGDNNGDTSPFASSSAVNGLSHSVNYGSSEKLNDSLSNVPISSSLSANILQRLANNPKSEVGRSVENIMARVRSMPNAQKINNNNNNNADATESSSSSLMTKSVMVTSNSDGKMSQSNAATTNGEHHHYDDSRMAVSMYDEPLTDGHHRNRTDPATATHFDIDDASLASVSRLANKVVNNINYCSPTSSSSTTTMTGRLIDVDDELGAITSSSAVSTATTGGVTDVNANSTMIMSNGSGVLMDTSNGGNNSTVIAGGGEDDELLNNLHRHHYNHQRNV